MKRLIREVAVAVNCSLAAPIAIVVGVAAGVVGQAFLCYARHV